MAEENVTRQVEDDGPPGAIQVALFGQNGLAFAIDNCEDKGTLTSHLAVLTKSTHALTRLIGEFEVEPEERMMRIAEARIGIEFLNSMCAAIADDLARTEGVHRG